SPICTNERNLSMTGAIKILAFDQGASPRVFLVDYDIDLMLAVRTSEELKIVTALLVQSPNDESSQISYAVPASRVTSTNLRARVSKRESRRGRLPLRASEAGLRLPAAKYPPWPPGIPVFFPGLSRNPTEVSGIVLSTSARGRFCNSLRRFVIV